MHVTGNAFEEIEDGKSGNFRSQKRMNTTQKFQEKVTNLEAVQRRSNIQRKGNPEDKTKGGNRPNIKSYNSRKPFRSKKRSELTY